MTFYAVVVFSFGYDFLYKYIVGHYDTRADNSNIMGEKTKQKKKDWEMSASKILMPLSNKF